MKHSLQQLKEWQASLKVKTNITLTEYKNETV